MSPTEGICSSLINEDIKCFPSELPLIIALKFIFNDLLYKQKHTSRSDVIVTVKLLKYQVKNYKIFRKIMFNNFIIGNINFIQYEKPTYSSINSNTKILLFGKYKGETIQSIYLKDPSYLVWILENKKKLSNIKQKTTIQYIENYYKTCD